MKSFVYTLLYITFVALLVFYECFESLNEVYAFTLIIVFVIYIINHLVISIMSLKRRKKRILAKRIKKAFGKDRKETKDLRRTGEEKTLKINAFEFGERWPFTVESGSIVKVGLSVFFRDESGAEWSLNGNSKDFLKIQDVRPIWKDAEEDEPGLKKSLSEFIQIGLDLK